MAEDSGFWDGVSLGSIFVSAAIFTIEWGFLHGGYVQSEAAINFIKGLTDPIFTTFGATKPAANDMDFSLDENGMPVSMSDTANEVFNSGGTEAAASAMFNNMPDAANDAAFDIGETLLSLAA